MFFINRLLLQITANEDLSNRYGFDIPFTNGLNVVAGQNSKGKSTIGACIYYALGMEELLGARNEQALGKALRTTFDVFADQSSESVPYTVKYSTVFIEITNNHGEIATIRRYINSGEQDERGHDLNSKKASVFNSTIEGIGSASSIKPLFIRNINNNTDEYGFYSWMANFIGLDLPEVVNTTKRSSGVSPLYLQTIFSAAFIEQTKGWSDFLASIPYFGIPRNKEKVVEFILSLSELSISTRRDELDREAAMLQRRWENAVSQIQMLATEHGGVVQLLSDKIISDPELLNLISLRIKLDEQDSDFKQLDDCIAQSVLNLEDLTQIPLRKVGENKELVRSRVEELYQIQENFAKQFEEFETTFTSQRTHIESLSHYLISLRRELAAHKGIQNIIDDAIVVEDVYNKCPTCKQTVSDDLMRDEGVTIEKLSLEQNIAYLSGQYKIVESSIKSLEMIIDEKTVIRKYYLKKQRSIEEEIKVALRELITDDREYSDTDSLRRVRVESKLNELLFLRNRFETMRTSLADISEQFVQNELLIDALDAGSSRDKLTLSEFERTFREDFLQPFKYSSNKVWNVHIQRDVPFKYFPVFKYSQDDELPQSIKTNSSASDFVRTLWAYSLALLSIGDGHPGVIIFDEPGQHSVSSASLRVLFEKSAALKDRQTIILTSVQKVLIRDGEKELDALDLDNLLLSLVEGVDYSLYRIDDDVKSIGRL